jgi:thiaminase/transcriptional activator TenA
MTYSSSLRREVDELWRAQLAHPFIRGVADGTLDHERFRHYVRQDYLFLVDYGRLLALASARAPRLLWQRRFAEVVVATLATEMDLHRELAAGWGIEAKELEAEQPTRTTRGYTDHLLRVATLGDYVELVSALLPCMWGYSWIGRELASEPPVARNPYAAWIRMYASDDFAELAAWCRTVLDEASGGLGDDAAARGRDAFVESSRLELAFWDASWRLEQT